MILRTNGTGKTMNILGTLAILVISLATCRAAIGFEKLTDLDYRGNTYYTIRNLTLYECQGWCREEPECQAAAFSFATNPLTPVQETVCLLQNETSASNPSATPSPAISTYYMVKLRIRSENVCSRPWTFERVPNKMLRGLDNALIFTSTKEACLAACLNERRFTCRSAEYNYVTLQCHLSEHDRRSVDETIELVDVQGVDYFENLCLTGDQACKGQREFVVPNIGVPNVIINRYVDTYYYVDLELMANNLEACRRACEIENEVMCRSFLYRGPPSGTTYNCQLFHLDHVTLPDGAGTYLSREPPIDPNASVGTYYENRCKSRPTGPDTGIKTETTTTVNTNSDNKTHIITSILSGAGPSRPGGTRPGVPGGIRPWLRPSTSTSIITAGGLVTGAGTGLTGEVTRPGTDTDAAGDTGTGPDASTGARPATPTQTQTEDRVDTETDSSGGGTGTVSETPSGTETSEAPDTAKGPDSAPDNEGNAAVEKGDGSEGETGSNTATDGGYTQAIETGSSSSSTISTETKTEVRPGSSETGGGSTDTKGATQTVPEAVDTTQTGYGSETSGGVDTKPAGSGTSGISTETTVTETGDSSSTTTTSITETDDKTGTRPETESTAAEAGHSPETNTGTSGTTETKTQTAASATETGSVSGISTRPNAGASSTIGTETDTAATDTANVPGIHTGSSHGVATTTGTTTTGTTETGSSTGTSLGGESVTGTKTETETTVTETDHQPGSIAGGSGTGQNAGTETETTITETEHSSTIDQGNESESGAIVDKTDTDTVTQQTSSTTSLNYKNSTNTVITTITSSSSSSAGSGYPGGEDQPEGKIPPPSASSSTDLTLGSMSESGSGSSTAEPSASSPEPGTGGTASPTDGGDGGAQSGGEGQTGGGDGTQVVTIPDQPPSSGPGGGDGGDPGSDGAGTGQGGAGEGNDVNCDSTGTCYDVTVQCKDTRIVVQVETNRPFSGRVYALGRSETCNIDVVQSTDFRLDLSLSGQDCNTQSMGTVFSNTVVVQHHSVVMTKTDKIYKVRCTYDMSSRNITFGMMPISSDAVQDPDSEFYDPLYETNSYGQLLVRDPDMISITSAPAAPPPRIQILDASGQEVDTVRIGDKLTFRIEIQPGTPYGIFARNCVAMAKDAKSTFQIIDAEGCPVDEAIFPRFNSEVSALQSMYEAFRFTESYGVIFQCNVKYCLGQCEPAECSQNGKQFQSWGRRKRALLPPVPAELAADPRDPESMTLSQEILVLDFGDEQPTQSHQQVNRPSAAVPAELPPYLSQPGFHPYSPDHVSFGEEAQVALESCPTRTSVMALSIVCALLVLIYVCSMLLCFTRRWMANNNKVL